MRNNNKRILGALAVAGLVATGGTAFTASNTFADGATAPKTGYGSTVVSGAIVDSLAYNLSTDGAAISNVTLKLATDTTTSAVSIAFNAGDTATCGVGAWDDLTDVTTYTCPGFGTTADLTQTAVVVN